MTTIDGGVLDGVSTTTLWTLHNRATEAKRPDGALRDPWAVTLFDSIRYDYLKFGKPNQSHGLRAVTFDREALAYLNAHPGAAVVALAEGLQTSFWRLREAGMSEQTAWYSIDLPPVMELRNALLPSESQVVELAQSALDLSWMDNVDATRGVFITAEGLLMYLDPADARALIAACAARFPGGAILFDSIPPWLSRKTLKGFKLSDRYVTPPMPNGLSADDAVALADSIPGVSAARDIRMAPGRGVFKLLSAPAFDRVPLFRKGRPSVTLLEFG